MQRLFDGLKRIWKSLRNIFSSMTDNLTKGTGTVVKTIGGAIGIGMVFIVIIGIMIIIGLAAIPYGAFAVGKDKVTEQNTSESVIDAEFTEDKHTAPVPFCEACGQTDVPTFKENDQIVCADCLREMRNRREESES